MDTLLTIGYKAGALVRESTAIFLPSNRFLNAFKLNGSFKQETALGKEPLTSRFPNRYFQVLSSDVGKK